MHFPAFHSAQSHSIDQIQITFVFPVVQFALDVETKMAQICLIFDSAVSYIRESVLCACNGKVLMKL